MAAGRGGVTVWICIAAITSIEATGGHFWVAHAPKYTGFVERPTSASALKTHEIPSVILATLGLPLSTDIEWDGLMEGNVFKRPKASVVLSVVAQTRSLELNHFKFRYNTIENDASLDADLIMKKIEREDWKKTPLTLDFYIDNSVLTVHSSSSERFNDLPTTIYAIADNFVTDWFTVERLGSLNISNDSDLLLISELYAIQEIIDLIKSDKSILTTRAPDFLHFSVGGLKRVQSEYGLNSVQANDAHRLIADFIDKISEEFEQLYNGNVVVQVVSFSSASDASPLIRNRRHLLQVITETDAANNITNLNLAPQFSDMYATMFNIILWTMIGFALAVFGISWGIWNMDPGRDSLIYRMTSQRIKRD